MPAKECPSNRVDELASKSKGKRAKPKKLPSSMSFYVGAAQIQGGSSHLKWSIEKIPHRCGSCWGFSWFPMWPSWQPRLAIIASFLLSGIFPVDLLVDIVSLSWTATWRGSWVCEGCTVSHFRGLHVWGGQSSSPSWEADQALMACDDWGMGVFSCAWHVHIFCEVLVQIFGLCF